MLVLIHWLDGSRTHAEIKSLRELDNFIGRCEKQGMRVDLKPYGLGLQVVLHDALSV